VAIVAVAIAAVAVGVALVLERQREPGRTLSLERPLTIALLALPGALTLFFAFNAGGFFPDAPAFVAIVLLVLLILRTTLSERPFAGFSSGLAAASVPLALYTVWMLLSALWSDAPARALIDADRALVYLLALVLLGSLPRTPERLRWMLRGVALAMVAVAVAGLATRLAPDVFPTAPNIANQRLSYPLTYWNGLGMLGSLAAIFCLYLTTCPYEPALVRVLASAALPPVATTVFFTFSRGAIGAGIVGLTLYLVLARPRGLLSAGIAAVPATVIAVSTAYGADLLATQRPVSAAAVDQGHHVALVVGACALAAAGIRAMLLPLDARLLTVRFDAGLRRPFAISASALGILVSALIIISHGPDRLHDQYRRFVETTHVAPSRDLRARLTDPANSGRVANWRVAMQAFSGAEATGTGSGTYGLVWDRLRPRALAVLVVHDAHSLYVENLAELGLVGFALVVSALLAIVSAFAPLRRGRDQALYAALGDDLACRAGRPRARRAGGPRPATPSHRCDPPRRWARRTSGCRWTGGHPAV
jgi:O-antigen ligase